MNPEPGWYHADGDPEGSVRLWNGTDWVGFPQRDPTAGPDELVGVKAFEPTLGQKKLKPIAIITQVLLVLFAVLQATFAYLTLDLARGIDEVSVLAGELTLDEDAESVSAAWGIVFGLLPLAQLLVAVFFLIWIYLAYSNLAGWRRTHYGTGWAIGAWFTPFLVWFRPGRIIMELMEHSPRADNPGAINPVWGVVWWGLWLAPQGVQAWLIIRIWGQAGTLLTDPTGMARDVLYALAIQAAITAAAVLVATVIVGLVTTHQDSRLVPSDEQVALFEREEQLQATLVPDGGAGGFEMTTYP